ncbi:hypothetical protein BJ508DRAFT_212917 [Ascobolus immersus RN42]|uniref:Uncharacterized protein n=1 Tax=Ascobolus immersus RN42 TaxID=1160509 RepID=A0A3N4HZP5_ASCIM|nr:hypothetical protein BJ508DRAFT_212917 [Ascobolus immersus RN42]
MQKLGNSVGKKTYSTEDSRVVTHRSTNLAIRSLTMGERTGSRIFFNLWPYVMDQLQYNTYRTHKIQKVVDKVHVTCSSSTRKRGFLVCTSLLTAGHITWLTLA